VSHEQNQSGVVEYTIEGRKFRHNLSGNILDRRGLTYIEREVLHPGVCQADLAKAFLPSATDDDLIPRLMKRLCQAFADP
jgi:hypothetical protein